MSRSNDSKDASLNDAVGRAIEFAKIATPGEFNVLPDNPGVTAVEGLHDPAIAGVPMETKIGLIKRLEKMALADSRIIKSAGAAYGEGEGALRLTGGVVFP